MNRFYEGWLQNARGKAEHSGLTWNPDFCAKTGKIEKVQRWGLCSLIGLPPPEKWLSGFQHLGIDIAVLGEILEAQGSSQKPTLVMASEWREFLQAAVTHELLIKRNKVNQAIAVARAVKTLSLCAATTAPWDVTAADIQRAYNVALRAGESGKLAMNLVMVVKNLFDNEHLGNRCPLAQFARPYPDEASRSAQKTVNRQKRRENSNYNVHTVRSRLTDRKTAERLPETRAFWELVRIVFTETPLTFTDRIRFGALKLQILAGLRIGESILIPTDCLRWREYFDVSGSPAGEKGGISRSLSLRYFVLKQEGEDVGHEVRLVQRLQEVPAIFETMFVDIVEEVSTAVAPLRQRLKAQTETKRLIPEYEPEALVGAAEMYTRVAGSIRITNEPISKAALALYRTSHSVEALAAIRLQQQRSAMRRRPVYQYWHTQDRGPPARDSTGRLITGTIDYRTAYFRVGEVEDFIRRALPTKLPDTTPFSGAGGEPIFPHQLLFLHPQRSLIEGRDGGLIDVERYFSIGRLSPQDLILQLSKSNNSIFARYGETPKDKTLSLPSHANRHLQNTELFRLGIADTMITKRFGRRTTAQSYTYDHRSLVEDLEAIELPPSAAAAVPERAHDTMRMILAGKLRGPLVEEFIKVQRTRGDDAAFEYIAAEADGLHATPYGFCLSAFTVDPCPKHLQCFNGCLHLARTDNPREQDALEKVHGRTIAVLAAAEASPARTTGRKNQIEHAKTILVNIEAAIATAPGNQVFPDGKDLSQPIGKTATIIDAALSAQGRLFE